MLNDDQIMLQAQNAGFNADVAHVVRTIAARHRARGAVLTWQLVREIREEALADIGLASRWPAQLLDSLAAAAQVPPFDGRVSAGDVSSLCHFAEPIREVFDPSGAS